MDEDDDMLQAGSIPEIGGSLVGDRPGMFPGPNLGYVPTEEEQELLNKLQVADYLYTQYELQVIYQLFKDMFHNKLTHGIWRHIYVFAFLHVLYPNFNGIKLLKCTGNPKDVQVAVERFATLLDNEKQFGRISEQLQSEITGIFSYW